MKQNRARILPSMVLLLSLTLFTACGTSPGAAENTQTSISQPPVASISLPASHSISQNMQPAEVQNNIYRGKVTNLSDDNIVVTQQAGHNYGYESVLFHLDDETLFDKSEIALATGIFVEVEYDGILTRSIPPQGTATAIKVISANADGVLVNGVIQNVVELEDGWQVSVEPFPGENLTADSSSQVLRENLIVLQVPQDGLEGLTADDLQTGVAVCAVTIGIATMSIPPQMPVYKLLAYSELEETTSN